MSNKTKDVFKSPGAMFKDSHTTDLALSLLNSLRDFEVLGKLLINKMDHHAQQVGEHLPDDMWVEPIQMTESGTALYGTGVFHTELVDFRGNLLGKHGEFPLDMVFETDGTTSSWASRMAGRQFAKRDAGVLNASTNAREGANAPWQLSSDFFSNPEPGSAFATLSVIKGLTDISVGKQKKLLVKLDRSIAKKSSRTNAISAPGRELTQAEILAPLIQPSEYAQSKAVIDFFRLGTVARDIASQHDPDSARASHKPKPRP